MHERLNIYKMSNFGQNVRYRERDLKNSVAGYNAYT